jgi:hypothetical protein
VYERIYKKLDKLTGGIESFASDLDSTIKKEQSCYMPLYIDTIGNNEIALAHYYKQNGDLCPDPDMQIKIVPEMKMAEALTLQDSFGFKQVYYEKDGTMFVNPSLKRDLNRFLDQWLTNLRQQGFYK